MFFRQLFRKNLRQGKYAASERVLPTANFNDSNCCNRQKRNRTSVCVCVRTVWTFSHQALDLFFSDCANRELTSNPSPTTDRISTWLHWVDVQRRGQNADRKTLHWSLKKVENKMSWMEISLHPHFVIHKPSNIGIFYLKFLPIRHFWLRSWH